MFRKDGSACCQEAAISRERCRMLFQSPVAPSPGRPWAGERSLSKFRFQQICGHPRAGSFSPCPIISEQIKTQTFIRPPLCLEGCRNLMNRRAKLRRQRWQPNCLPEVRTRKGQGQNWEQRGGSLPWSSRLLTGHARRAATQHQRNAESGPPDHLEAAPVDFRSRVRRYASFQWSPPTPSQPVHFRGDSFGSAATGPGTVCSS